ncbi:acyl-CoA thioesterase [Costertonia aggregata]|uniref:Acyl-CoA thioesterase n=1 Tax=Costertonia aggregata TaxID=343403 RepID=A0A7H9AJM2_9FLAO|nr:acyl-CoA thioesterase [Costertonia aggregata]QLG43816.1 acyl-CoA thioesterase [Costertonia aggregata]
METYSKSIKVVEGDLDDLHHVNNVRYVQWMQDIAKEHWQTKAPASVKKGVAWVVLSHTIQYKGAAKLGDTIMAKTYISKTDGAVSTRVVEMHDKETEKLLVRSQTEWCLLNADNMRPMRISSAIENVFI